MVCIGLDAFLTLEEAQAAARRAFEGAAIEAAIRARALTLALEKIDQGELCVHDLTSLPENSRISELHAFPVCPP
jgi:hypothetical protein